MAVDFADPTDHDLDFLGSTWTCIWGRGCVGILDEPAEHLGHGCCSVGAEMLDVDEAMTIAALAATLDPDRFEYHDTAQVGGVLTESRTNTRVVDGACIFLNRPGFAGGAGCALHLAAAAAGEPPLEWKPSVCWQLPIKLDTLADGRRRLRRWQRSDWGEGGDTMAWLCTDPDTGSYLGDTPVIESLADELTALLGREVYVELRAAVEQHGFDHADGAGS